MLFFEKDMTDFIISSVYFSSAYNEYSKRQLNNIIKRFFDKWDK